MKDFKKVGITGGAGFIASHIADHFIAQGKEVFVVDDLSTGFREQVPEGAKFYEVDVCEEALEQVFSDEQPDVIVHAAAQMSVRVSMQKPVFDAHVNVVGMARLLAAANSTSKPYVVLLSTGGAIYGEQETYPAPETHTIAPTSLYGLNKHVAEQYLELWRREFGVNSSALRLANVYGPRQNPHGEAGVVAIFYETLLSGKLPKIFGDGEQTRDFIYVADVVRAVDSAVNHQPRGSFNIGTGIETSVNQLFTAVSNTIGGAKEVEYCPARLGEQQRSSIDSAKAKQTFGWSPQVSLTQGLELTAAWYKQNA